MSQKNTDKLKVRSKKNRQIKKNGPQKRDKLKTMFQKTDKL